MSAEAYEWEKKPRKWWFNEINQDLRRLGVEGNSPGQWNMKGGVGGGLKTLEESWD